PAVAEIHRFGHDSSLLHGRRNADREDVVSPVACQRGDALDELLRGQGRPRVEAPPLAAARAQHLDAGPADVDGKDGRRDGAYTGSRTIIAIAAWWAPVSARATSPEDSRRWSTLESYSSVATASGAATSATRRAYSFARARTMSDGSGDELGVARCKRRVASAAEDQVVVPAVLDDAAVVEHDDLVGVAHGREPVGDRDRRSALGETVERLLHEPLGLGVERARRLVEDEDRRVPQDRPRDRNPLLLAAGEPVAAFADDRVVAVGQGRDDVMDPRSLGGRLDLVIGGIRLRKPEVLSHRRVEEVGLLRDHPDEVGERLEAQVADVGAVDRDPAARDVVQPRRQVAECRLAGAGLADERRGRAGGDGEGDVLQRPVVAVPEPHTVEDDVSRLRDGDRVRPLLDLDRLGQGLEDPVEERGPRLPAEPAAQQPAD